MPRKFSGEKLEAARKERNLSRSKLSKLTAGEVSQDAIRRYERGENVPKVDAMLLLAEALGINPGKLSTKGD